MMATVIKCNMCGGEIIQKYNSGFKVNHTYGYNSVFDCSSLELDLCDDCLDKLTKHLIQSCKINPVID